MKVSLMRGALAASVFAFAFSGAASLQAATVIDGMVAGGDAWSYVPYIHTGGNLTVDIRASGWTEGLNGEGLDDPYIEFYVNDGSLPGPFPLGLTGAWVASNDDSDFTNPGVGGAADGSTAILELVLVFACPRRGQLHPRYRFL